MEVVEMKLKNPTLSSHCYLVSFNKDFHLNKVKDIQGASNIRNKCEQYAPRRTKVTHCHRCQRLGHKQSFCNLVEHSFNSEL